MKHKIITYSLLFATILIVATGCKKLLEEQPRTSFTPPFLQQLMVFKVELPVFIPVSAGNGLRRYGPSYLIPVRMKSLTVRL